MTFQACWEWNKIFSWTNTPACFTKTNFYSFLNGIFFSCQLRVIFRTRGSAYSCMEYNHSYFHKTTAHVTAGWTMRYNLINIFYIKRDAIKVLLSYKSIWRKFYKEAAWGFDGLKANGTTVSVSVEIYLDLINSWELETWEQQWKQMIQIAMETII